MRTIAILGALMLAFTVSAQSAKTATATTQDPATLSASPDNTTINANSGSDRMAAAQHPEQQKEKMNDSKSHKAKSKKSHMKSRGADGLKTTNNNNSMHGGSNSTSNSRASNTGSGNAK